MNTISLYAMPCIYIQRIQNLTPDEKIKMVIDTVCSHYGVTFQEIDTKCRKRKLTITRQVIMYMLNIKLGISTVAIGQIFKQKFDHTTVIYSRELVRNLISVGELTEDIRIISRKLPS